MIRQILGKLSKFLEETILKATSKSLLIVKHEAMRKTTHHLMY